MFSRLLEVHCYSSNTNYSVKYRARINRVKKVREGLENSLRGRIELIDSYARVCFYC